MESGNQIIAESTCILNSPALVSELVIENKTFVDTGQNEYYFIPEILDLFFLPESEIIEAAGTAFREEIRQSIQNQSFDHILITQKMPSCSIRPVCKIASLGRDNSTGNAGFTPGMDVRLLALKVSR